MRTSRISRDTAHLVNALSPARRVSARQASRISTNGGATNGHKSEDDISSDGDGSGSAFSSPPSSPEHAQDNETTLGKRKRSNTTPSKHNDASSARRRSSRKAIKTDPDTETKEKIRRRPAKRITGPNGAFRTGPPYDWEQMYSITARMRKRVLAPVDTMGCESLAEEHIDPKSKRLQTLVALMLSSQTKDTVTAVAMKNLQNNLPGGFTLDALLKIEPDALNDLIAKVGFHNNKTKFIKRVAEILRDQFDGDIPDTIEGLVSLPGVGPKMAYLCMSSAWGRDEGIGVDVHVHRITNLWGWHKTSNPEQTRAELESWLPKEKWHDINHLLVGFGQTICLPVGRRCYECDLAPTGLCPSVVSGSPRKKTVKKEAVIKAELELDSEGGAEMIRTDAVKGEKDDVGIKIEADLEDAGQVEIQEYQQKT